MESMAGMKKINIATSVSSGHILISVSDSGPGIREPARNCIFDPFYTTKPDSTGIGLSICHRIIRDHDGVIHVGTGKLGGAEFTIRLPIRSNGESDRQNA
jgi:signal transduction histidine kinase